VSNFCIFFKLFDIFANLNDFLQIIGFSSIFYYKYDTYFSLLLKKIYMSIPTIGILIYPVGHKNQIFVYSLHRFLIALIFYKNVIILK
jgi:hypothetical protein